MDFVEWWKKSSKEASDTHFALRFDDHELNQLRHGLLSDLAKRKVQARLNALKKRNKLMLFGCGLPLAGIGLAALAIFGYVFFQALSVSVRNPIAWFLVTLFVIVVTTMLIFFLKILFEWQRRKNSTAIDLKDNKIALESGKVLVKIERSEDGFNFIYSINGFPFSVLEDVIGWEIHTHFFAGANITGQTDRETIEIYNFFFLPKSRILLHFEFA